MKVIHLTKGRFSLVDDEDYERVNQFKWHANEKYPGCFYAYRKAWIPSEIRTSKIKGLIYHGYYKTIPMHRFIMNEPQNMEIDHIDGNGLNNQKNNLRLATHQQNMMNNRVRKTNKVGVAGICWDKANSKWRAFIQYKGKSYKLGRFTNIADAIKARKDKEKELFGDFLRQS